MNRAARGSPPVRIYIIGRNGAILRFFEIFYKKLIISGAREIAWAADYVSAALTTFCALFIFFCVIIILFKKMSF